MKNYIKIVLAVFVAVASLGCESDDDIVNVNEMDAPENLGATFQITQDNSGLVTITPTGEGATLYTVDFGDGSTPSEEIRIGQSVDHIYEEGQYDVEIIGKNLAGETATGIQPLTVSFLAPEDLEVDITRDPDDNFTISVSATAENAAMFEVYFGDDEDEEPTPLMPGETVSHTYSTIGTYDVRVVALSGGAATTEVTTEVNITNPLFLPIDFESETLNYTFTNFGGGEGAGAPVVENPDPSGINTSEMVASYTKPAGSETWAGTTIALDEPIDFSTTRFVAVDVWSPAAGVDVILKVENLGNADINAEFTATTTVGNEWETLIFDLGSIDPEQEYGRVVLFFNFGVSGTGETYYFDNIRTTQLELTKLPLTFESENLEYSWGGFGGATGSVIANPDASGINTSSNVTELVKAAGAETWAGISLNLDEPVDFSSGTTVKMKVWSPAAGVPVLFKFEDSNSEPDANGNPSVIVEVIRNTTTSNEWEELTFDLTTFEAFSPTATYDRVIVFYNFGNTGTGSTFYFDDIRLTSDAEPTAVALPLLFENEDLTYNWGGFGGATGTVVDNPDPSGVNNSDKVTLLNKSNGAQTWGGISLNLERPLDFLDGTYAKMKVWSPEAGVPVLLKFEDSDSEPNQDGNPSVFIEVIVNTTTANAWEELTFDLTSYENFNPAVSYDRVIVFYDFGNPGEGTDFYFDEIELSTVPGNTGGNGDGDGDGDGDGASGPTTAAGNPTLAAANVISLFSDAYTNVTVDTWRTPWSVGDYEEVSLDGNETILYSNLDFVGIETVAAPVDISEMTHLHIDFWTGDLTEFRIKLVDFGANGVYDGGDDVEHEIRIENPAQNQWVSMEIPLSDFTGLTSRSDIGQLILSGSPTGGSVYVDNIYFHN